MNAPVTDPVAESCLVAGVILDPSTIPAICAHAGGVPKFYSESNRTIFETAKRLHDSGADADAAAVYTALNSAGQLAAAGGEDRIKALLDSVPSGINWRHYLRLVTTAARKRELADACETALHHIRTGADIEDCVRVAADGLAAAARDTGAPKDVTLQDAAGAVLADLEAGRPTIFPTGLTGFDEAFGGVPMEGVTTFLGVPGSGKSSLVAGIALRVADTGRGVRIFSYEMSAHSVTANLMSARAEVCVNEALRTGRKPTAGEMYQLGGAVDSFGGVDLAFVDELLNARQIEERAAVYATKGVRCIVVDYIQNLPPAEAGQSDVSRVEEACRAMQRIARRHRMAVFMVSQMTGQAAREDRPPRKSDGINSAAIDQVSDCTIGVYRPVVFNPRTPDESDIDWNSRKHYAQLHVLKNKKGPCGAVDAVFEGRWTRFADRLGHARLGVA